MVQFGEIVLHMRFLLMFMILLIGIAVGVYVWAYVHNKLRKERLSDEAARSLRERSKQ